MNALHHCARVSLCVAAVLGSTAVMAAQTTVDVTATVVGTCMFDSSVSTVAFDLNPASTAPAIGTVTQPKFWCTKNATYGISDDDGQNETGTTHRMKHSVTNDYIPYSFSYTASGTGAGKSSPIALDITAEVANVDFVDAPEGSYADKVTLTITP